MILADKIIEERKRNGWSQEDLAEMLSVSRQAVSKWESAQSVPDLQRVIRMAELFGVSTDYLLKDEMGCEQAPKQEWTENPKETYVVTMEEANEFLDMRKKQSPVIAGGVALCIISPALLIMLAGFSESLIFGITEGLAVGVGFTVLLGMIAAAVFLFITTGIRAEKFEFLERTQFETEYGVSGLVKEKKKEYEGTFGTGIAIGVTACIVAVIPLVIGGVVNAPDYILTVLVALLLATIAAGVYLIVRVSMIRASFDTLLQEGEYNRREKASRAKVSAFSSAYWLIFTAIYLGWSFYTMRWDFTWIVWPVAGVLYGAVSAILRAVYLQAE